MRILALTLLLLATAAGLPAATQAPNTTRRLTILLPRAPLREVVREVAAGAGVRVELDPRIADDPVTCLVRERSAEEVLNGLCLAMRYRMARTGNTIRLHLEPAVAAAVQRLHGLDGLEEQRVTEAGVALRGALTAALDPAPDAPVSLHTLGNRTLFPGITALLGSLRVEQRDLLAAAAPQDPGVLNATGPANWHGSFFFAAPLSELPPAARYAVADALRRRTAAGDSGDPVVGIVAAGGSLTLGVERHDEQGGTFVELVEPSTYGGPEISEAQAHHSELAQALRAPAEALQREPRSGWLDPEGQALPAASCRGWDRAAFMLAVNPAAARNRADRVLRILAGRPGVSIIGDAFVGSTFGAAPPLFGVPAESRAARQLREMLGLPAPRHTPTPAPAPAAVWAQRCARSFGRRYRCEGVCCCCRAVALWKTERPSPRGRLLPPCYKSAGPGAAWSCTTTPPWRQDSPLRNCGCYDACRRTLAGTWA